MKILFSPVGMTDPVSEIRDPKTKEITGVRDGSLLQICRHYQPDVVYMYMSAETIEYEKMDGRYEKSIRLVGQEIGQEIRLEKIEHPELTEVQLFDPFLTEFQEILNGLHEKHPDAELLVNVSSGTPAMKSALQILAAASNLKLTPLQVTTASKRSNNGRPHCDIEAEWQSNQDNLPDAPVRVQESGNRNLLREFNKKALCNLIDQYDYKGAKTVADQIRSLLPADFRKMLEGAVLRFDLKPKEAAKCFLELNQNGLLSPYCHLTAEYFLLLDIMVKKKAYSDFLRAMTPVVLELFRSAVKQQLGVNLSDYTNSRNPYNWDIGKLKDSPLDGKFNQLAKYHPDQFKPKGCNGGIPDGYMYSWHLTNLIENLSKDEAFITETIRIRRFEEKIRNLAAHMVRSFTASEIRSETGKSPEDIIEMLYRYMKYTDIPVTEDTMRSYQRMNDILKSMLE